MGGWGQLKEEGWEGHWWRGQGVGGWVKNLSVRIQNIWELRGS